MLDDAYAPDAIRHLAGMELTKRDPDDPLVRWVAEFLEDPRDIRRRPRAI